MHFVAKIDDNDDDISLIFVNICVDARFM